MKTWDLGGRHLSQVAYGEAHACARCLAHTRTRRGRPPARGAVRGGGPDSQPLPEPGSALRPWPQSPPLSPLLPPSGVPHLACWVAALSLHHPSPSFISSHLSGPASVPRCPLGLCLYRDPDLPSPGLALHPVPSCPRTSVYTSIYTSVCTSVYTSMYTSVYALSSFISLSLSHPICYETRLYFYSPLRSCVVSRTSACPSSPRPLPPPPFPPPLVCFQRV